MTGGAWPVGADVACGEPYLQHGHALSDRDPGVAFVGQLGHRTVFREERRGELGDAAFKGSPGQHFDQLGG